VLTLRASSEAQARPAYLSARHDGRRAGPF
jgi:hypothetical protein